MSTTSKVVRIGILGAAHVAPSALIAPARDRSDVEVVCVAARDPARAAEFARRHGIPDVEPTYDAVLARADVDLVYVPLPPSSHAEWTIRALHAGKAVLCEKPFAVSAAEAQAMVSAAARAGRPLLEAFHYRFHAVVHRLEALITNGALGRVREATAVFEAHVPPGHLLWRGDLGCGALTDVGCYPLHALRTLFGEPSVRTATIRETDGTIVFAEAELDFPRGVVGRMRSAMNRLNPSALPPEPNPTIPQPEWWLRITGERGRIEVWNFVVPHVYGCEFVTEIDGVQRLESVAGPTTYEAQLAHVVDVLHGRAEPMTGGRDAIANMALIDAIRRAGTVRSPRVSARGAGPT
jgi:predicted dehydrogenase